MESIIEQVSEYELQRGKPVPTLNHAYLQTNLLFSLDYWYRKTYTILSELNLTIPAYPDMVPDIAIYPKLQIDFLHDVSSMTEMPLTVIEIVSPSQSDAEIVAKFDRYFEAGVQSCWLVLPVFKAISVYTSLNQYKFFTDDTTLIDPTTGVELALKEIFA